MPGTNGTSPQRPTRRLWRAVAIAVFVGLLATAGPLALRATSQLAAPARTPCGLERWGVKTLADRRVDWIRLRPNRISIVELASVLPPSGITNVRANDRIELQVFRITGLLREAADEDDQDIELIVTDPKQPGVSMLVEFPATACTHGAPAKLRRQMSRARANFMRACGGPATGNASSPSSADGS